MKRSVQILITIVCVAQFVPSDALATEARTFPNVIFILADDLGYGDVHANNPKSKIATPALDRLAAEGMRFTDGHSPSGVCTPTRYGILTGRYCWRTRLKKGVLWGIDRSLIDPDRTTMADVFHSKGYATACIGKWHLGMDIRDVDSKFLDNDRRFEREPGLARIDYQQQIEHSPLAYGFDESYVIIGSLNMMPYTYVDGDRFVEAATEFQPRTEHAITIVSGGPKAPSFDYEAVMDVFTEKACSFVRRESQAKRPFFLYFPLSAPHKPVLPTAKFKGKSGLGIYGDFVMQVDATMAAIDDVLRETDAKKNTIVVFTSDNGSFMYRYSDDKADHVKDDTAVGYHPANHQSNHVWRGTKADIYEGGHRVPLIVRWPGVIDAGTTCRETTTLTDWFTTFAEILSHPLSENEGEDSVSLLPLLRGGNEWQRAPVIHHSSGGMFAIRDGRWKLIAGNGSGGRQSPRGKAFTRPYQLYDLQADASEKDNLIDKQPQIAERLEKRLNEIRERGRSRPLLHPENKAGGAPSRVNPSCDVGLGDTLPIPSLSAGRPGAGKLVAVTPPEYAGTDVFHTLYLPEDWDPNWRKTGKRLPIIFEYAGNKWAPGGSTGEPEGACLGYGLSAGRYIWVSLPYVSSDHKDNEVTWWGDTAATVRYAKTNVPRVLEEYGGDPSAVFLCGFSRGAIAVNYIGLHDDEIAGLWTAFIAHDHFDGAKEWRRTTWGSPLKAYRAAAAQRLLRVKGRPYMVRGRGGKSDTEEFVRSVLPVHDNFFFYEVDMNSIFPSIPNEIVMHPHTDRWLLVPSIHRDNAWKWMNEVVDQAKHVSSD